MTRRNRATWKRKSGAYGILIDRKIAQRAGLSKISDTTVGGFGDQGKSAGYVAQATDVKIGAFEFRDCTVTVIDKRSVLGGGRIDRNGCL